MIFDTPRLHVRPWTRDDPAAGLRRVLTPAVLQHLPPPLHDTDPEQWINARLAKSDVFAVLTQGRLIGLVLIARLEVLRAGVARGNPASARVLEKAGFTVLDEGPEMVTYQRGPA